MSLQTIKQSLLAETSTAGAKANAAFHLLMLLEQYENGSISKMEVKTKIIKCKKSHKRTNNNYTEVNNICEELLQNI